MLSRTLVITGALAALVTAVALAQPTTRPGGGPGHPERVSDRDRPDRPDRAGWGDRGERGSDRSDRGGWQRPISAEEQARAFAFIATHMPELHDAIEDAEKGSPAHRRMIRFAIDRHRWAERLERDDPRRYEQMLSRLRAQDDIFALLRKYHASPAPQQTELRAQMRVKVREMVQDLIEERERRIEHLKRMLDREAQELERDRQNVEALTTQRLNRMLDEMREMGKAPGEADPSADAPATLPAEPTVPRQQ